MSRPFPLILASLAALFAAPALAAGPSPQPPTSPYAALAALEARVAAIGFRLTTANAAFCPVVQAQFGWILGDPRLYDKDRRADGLAAYGATTVDAPFLAALAPESPAAKAGARVGNAVLAVDGASTSRDGGNDGGGDEGGDAFSRITALETRLGGRSPDAAIDIVTGAGDTIRLTAVAGCVSDFRVEPYDRPSGAADGRLVLISAGLARFAANDDELAAAVAHELAHNILRHRARLDAAGVDRGLGKQFGRSARLFRQTEVEADRLSVWLLHASGYSPEAAVQFWKRFGQRNGPTLFQSGTHPRWQARVKALDDEIAAIRAAETAGTPLVPPLIAEPPALE